MIRREKKPNKNFATENVLKKANQMMTDQADVFNDYGLAVSRDGEGRYSGGDLKSGLIRLDYEIRNKFLTRIYETRLTMDFREYDLPESFTAECIFTGQIKTVAAYFKIRKGSREAADFLHDDKLTAAIRAAAREVSFGAITVAYNANESRLRVIIKPYAGFYLWIKFPPVSKAIPLHDDEIEKVCELIHLMVKLFNNRRGQ